MVLSDVLRCVLCNIVCPCWFWLWSTNNVIHNTSKNVRQYNGQNQQGQTMLYKTHRRTSDNTIAKTNKDRQCYTKHIEERQTILWPKSTYDIVCPRWFWLWYCLTFFNVFCITLFVLVGYGQHQQGQTMLYKTHRRTSDNTIAKTNKDKQCYTKHIEERQTIP
jgi:hypothetical protein